MEPTSAPAKPARPAKPKATEADLDQDPSKVQKGKGPVGSRENPEVYENVPGHIIPILADEFDDFDDESGNTSTGRPRRTTSSASASSRASTGSASPECR